MSSAPGQTSARALLQVRDLEVEFDLHRAGTVQALRGVSFDVPEARTVALVGESGSGKSVVAQSIMGILPGSARIRSGAILFHDPLRADGGVIDIAATDPDSKAFRALRGARMSMIFQEPMTSLSPLHTVGDQVGEAVRLHQNASKREALRLAREVLSQVGFPDPLKALDTYPFELSGGLRQRAMIAMALVCRPALLIADEPTTALDVTIQAQILSLLRELQDELGMAILLITHDLGVVANMADDVVVVYHGQVMERGEVHEIFDRPGHPYLQSLMRAVPRIGMAEGERLTPIREVERAGGGHLQAREVWPEGADEAGPLLSIDRVSKQYTVRKGSLFSRAPVQGVQALSDVSLHIERGECLGLVGESGCGKTTLSKIIMHAVRPDVGTVQFNDRGRRVDLLALKGDELVAMRRRIQLIFQDPFSSLNPRMTVMDIISEPLIIHGMSERDERAVAVQELMRLVGLDPRFLSRYPHSFSGGQRQRIGIARALALNPELLICDEPVSALDVSVQAQVLNLLRELKSELSLTYLFVSHNLAVVDYMADRIAVMCGGHLVEVAPRDSIFSDAMHPYTQALISAVPRVDPTSRLDLTALMEGRVSIPSQWPSPFTIDEQARPQLVEMAPGHLVRCAERQGVAA
ncbi:MAG: peptide/nickel transport system ATP-binding protein [Gammaproteobacteria bacterium]